MTFAILMTFRLIEACESRGFVPCPFGHFFRIAPLDRRTERRIEQSDVVAGGVQVLKEEEHEGEFVQEANAQHDAPEGRMRPDERSIAELNHREEQERSCRCVDASVSSQQRRPGGRDMRGRGSGKTEQGRGRERLV